MPNIVIEQPGKENEIFDLVSMLAPEQPRGSTTLVLGRDQAMSHFGLNDRRISQQHASILVVKSTNDSVEYLLTDLDSSNGTYLNGKRLDAHAPPTRLNSGDRIELGRGIVTLHFLEDDATLSQSTLQTGRTAAGHALSSLGVDLSNLVNPRGRRMNRALPWLRLAAAVLGILAASMGIAYWALRFLAGS